MKTNNVVTDPVNIETDNFLSEGVQRDVIAFFQRLLNPGGIERFAQRIGIKIPVGQMFQETQLFRDLVTEAFPVAPQMAATYMSNYHAHFISIPPEQAQKELEAMGVISTGKKCLTIFNTVICWGDDETPWTTYAIVAGGVLVLAYLFLKA